MNGDALLIKIGRGRTVVTLTLVEALTARPAEGEEIKARGSLRVGGAALKCVSVLTFNGASSLTSSSSQRHRPSSSPSRPFKLVYHSSFRRAQQTVL